MRFVGLIFVYRGEYWGHLIWLRIGVWNETLSLPSTHADVNEKGCLALAYIAANEANQVIVAAAGACGGDSGIQKAMTAHADHAGVYEYGWVAFVELVFM